jgi:hypothetical protein
MTATHARALATTSCLACAPRAFRGRSRGPRRPPPATGGPGQGWAAVQGVAEEGAAHGPESGRPRRRRSGPGGSGCCPSWCGRPVDDAPPGRLPKASAREKERPSERVRVRFSKVLAKRAQGWQVPLYHRDIHPFTTEGGPGASIGNKHRHQRQRYCIEPDVIEVERRGCKLVGTLRVVIFGAGLALTALAIKIVASLWTLLA